MGIFSGVSDPKNSAGNVTERNPFFVPDDEPVGATFTGRVRITRVHAFTSRNRVPFFCVEAAIETTNREDRPEGTVCIWMQKLNIDAGIPSMKRFIAEAMKEDLEKQKAEDGGGDGPLSVEDIDRLVTEEVCEYITGEDQPLEGLEMHLHAEVRSTQNGDGKWTAHSFRLA